MIEFWFILTDDIKEYIFKAWKRITGLDEEILLQIKPGCPLKVVYGPDQLAFSRDKIIGTLKNDLYEQTDEMEYYDDEKEGLNELLRIVKKLSRDVPPEYFFAHLTFD